MPSSSTNRSFPRPQTLKLDLRRCLEGRFSSVLEQSRLLPQPFSAIVCPAETRYAVLLDSFVGTLAILRIFIPLMISVVESQLFSSLDISIREERNLIQHRIIFVLADDIDNAVRVAGVVDEARRAAKELAVDLVHVCPVLQELVEGE